MEKNKDHRDLGRIMDLFSFQEIAPGAPFWHANGMIIFKELEKLVRETDDAYEYQEVSTPIMVKSEVFKKSGHWEHYRDNMFYFTNPRDKNEELVIKPMNCPESTYIYNSQVRSYRDLPLRLSEIGRLHRNEPSGTLGGLLRVRQMTMDDAHVYCRPDQVESEIKTIVKIIDEFYARFGLKSSYVVATRPEKFLGEKEDWDKAETALKNAMDATGIKYTVEEGSGAFYGPKIEVHAQDSQGRDWQLGTAQLDLVMLPKQFETTYVDKDGKKQMPWVIHRAIFGTFERFIAILLEDTNGHLPLWMAPVQVTVVNVGADHAKYAAKISEKMRKSGIRVNLRDDNLTVSKRIREAEISRSSYIIVVGDKEIADKTVTIRHYEKGDVGTQSLNEFIKSLEKEIAARE